LLSSISFVVVYYPWGHIDSKSPDNEALQALGRKINSFNEYKLWVGSQPDFLYAASGDTSNYMYAALGVASLGLEIRDNFYQECDKFKDKIVPINMPALMYAAKIARTPFREGKGPDVLDFKIDENGQIIVSARASNSKMMNAIGGSFPDFSTGNQLLAEVRLYIDVRLDDYKQGDSTSSWLMQPTTKR
jgi:carboxypeptidase T